MYDVKYESFTFKGGEPHIKLDMSTLDKNVETIQISHRINSWNNLGELIVMVNSIRNYNKNIKLNLVLPYFPGARQDRVMVQGEPFTSAVYVKELDKLGFESITSLDLHSDVVAGMFAVLNTTFITISNHKFVRRALTNLYPNFDSISLILISPDAGANKKILGLAKYLLQLNEFEIVKCDKTRDVFTGTITDFEV